MKVKDFFAGNFSKDYLTKRLGPILIINLCFWIILSAIFYEGFDWTRMDVSCLGAMNQNPIGWFFGL